MASDISRTPPIPTYDKMLWPTLLALRELGGSGGIVELNDKAIELAGYTEEQQAVAGSFGGTPTLLFQGPTGQTQTVSGDLTYGGLQAGTKIVS